MDSARSVRLAFCRKSKKPSLNDSIRKNRKTNFLNTSRKILQKSVNYSITAASSLRTNNASLAKKVAELQIELNAQRTLAQEATLELCKYRLEVARLRSFLQLRDKLKSNIIGLREILGTLLENGMSAIQSVNDMSSALDMGDGCDKTFYGTSGFLSETAVDLSNDMELHSSVQKSVQMPNQVSTKLPAINLPTFAKDSVDINSSKLPVTDQSMVELSLQNEPSQLSSKYPYQIPSQSPTTDRKALKPSSLNQLTEQSQPCPSTNRVPAVQTRLTTSPAVCEELDEEDADVEQQPDNAEEDSPTLEISATDLALDPLPSSCAVVLTCPTIPSSPAQSPSRQSPKASHQHEEEEDRASGGVRRHPIRQARLNAKPIIDQSSVMDSPSSPKLAKSSSRSGNAKRRRILVHTSDSEEDEALAGGKFEQDPRDRPVVEACFHKPGQLVFRADTKTTRSKPRTVVEQGQTRPNKEAKARSKKNEHSRNEANQPKEASDSRNPSAQSKPKSVFDLTLNQTANMSILPSSLNELRTKQQHNAKDQDKDGKSTAQYEDKTKPTHSDLSRRILGNLPSNTVNGPFAPPADATASTVPVLSLSVKSSDPNQPYVMMHPLLSDSKAVLLDVTQNENNPHMTRQRLKRRFRRLYLNDDDEHDKQKKRVSSQPCVK